MITFYKLSLVYICICIVLNNTNSQSSRNTMHKHVDSNNLTPYLRFTRGLQPSGFSVASKTICAAICEDVTECIGSAPCHSDCILYGNGAVLGHPGDANNCDDSDILNIKYEEGRAKSKRSFDFLNELPNNKISAPFLVIVALIFILPILNCKMYRI